jgi:DNA-binding transcriptional LysR family regulator
VDRRNALEASFNPSTSDRVFKVLVSNVGAILFLPPLVTRVAVEGGRLGVRAVPLDSRHFELKLESGEADLALGAFPGAPRGLKRQRLYFSNYLSVVREIIQSGLDSAAHPNFAPQIILSSHRMPDTRRII